MNKTYKTLKYFLYTISLLFTIYSIITDGIGGSHTPPLGFVIPVLIILTSLFFIVMDFLFRKRLKNYQSHLSINIAAITINLIIVVSILAVV